MALPLSTAEIPPALLATCRLVGQTPFIISEMDSRVSFALYIPEKHYNPDPQKQYKGTDPVKTELYSRKRLPLLAAIHGTTRDSSTLLKTFMPLADAERVAIIVPHFPAGITGPDDWDSYKLGVTEGFQAASILSSILDREVAQRWPGVDTQNIWIQGFSGGASFAQRFALLCRKRVVAASIGAPGQLTNIGEEGARLEWPSGYIDKIPTSSIIDDASRISWQLLVGELDNSQEGSLEKIAELCKDWKQAEERGESIDWTKVIRDNFPSRMDILRKFESQLNELGAKSVRFEVIPGAKHQLDPALSAIEAFFADEIRKWWDGSAIGS